MKFNRYHFTRLEPIVALEDEGQYPNSLLIEPWLIDEDDPGKGYTSPLATNAWLDLPGICGDEIVAHTLYLLLVIDGQYHVFRCSHNDDMVIPMREEEDEEDTIQYYFSISATTSTFLGEYPYLTSAMPEEYIFQGGENTLPECRKMLLVTTLKYLKAPDADRLYVVANPVYVIQEYSDDTGDRFILEGASVIAVELTQHYVELADEVKT